MTSLDSFAITKKWPAVHPDRIQLYSLPTPNGVKVSIDHPLGYGRGKGTTERGEGPPA